MLTYEDCLGLCELTAGEIAAIARHEHLPEILALELGAHLCSTPKGRRTIRRMIQDDIDDARARGELDAVAELELVRERFAATFPDPAPAIEPDRCPTTPPGDTLEHRIHALGFDADAAPWVRQRVEAYLTAMVRQFGLDLEHLQDRFRLELLAAETRCAACPETTRCRRFLAGATAAAADTPEAFCANARLFRELQQRG
jgi:hypothetical protein